MLKEVTTRPIRMVETPEVGKWNFNLRRLIEKEEPKWYMEKFCESLRLSKWRR